MRRAICGAALASAALGVAGLAGAGPSYAGNSVVATVNVGVRSVTVSSAAETLSNCYTNNAAFVSGVNGATEENVPPGNSSALGFPNGWCLSPQVTVTNGDIADHIDVQGTNATPVGGTGGWTLVQASGPGTDQFDLDTESVGFATDVPANDLQQYSTTSTPACDGAFDNGLKSADEEPGAGQGCAALANSYSLEYIGIDGPSAPGAGDTATSESATVTWTAVP